MFRLRCEVRFALPTAPLNMTPSNYLQASTLLACVHGSKAQRLSCWAETECSEAELRRSRSIPTFFPTPTMGTKLLWR